SSLHRNNRASLHAGRARATTAGFEFGLPEYGALGAFYLIVSKGPIFVLKNLPLAEIELVLMLLLVIRANLVPK
ncbi:Hypothetical predicted protein, partial [Olea europaea subsp. europaea]